MVRICELMMSNLLLDSNITSEYQTRQINELFIADPKWGARNALELSRELASKEQRFFLACGMLIYEKNGENILIQLANDCAEKAIGCVPNLKSFARISFNIVKKYSHSNRRNIMMRIARLFVDISAIGISGTYRDVYNAVTASTFEHSDMAAQGAAYSLVWACAGKNPPEKSLDALWDSVTRMLIELLEQ